jgi:hypothetical protein
VAGDIERSREQNLNGLLDITDAAAGMRTIGWLPTQLSDKAVAQRAGELGLEVMPLSTFATKHAQRPGLLLGFAGCSPGELGRGVSQLFSRIRHQYAIQIVFLSLIVVTLTAYHYPHNARSLISSQNMWLIRGQKSWP